MKEEDFEAKKREAEAARKEQESFEKILQEEIDDYLADESHSPDEDVLENPIFKRYFDELIADPGMTEDQKTRFGEVINLLTVVSPEDFDNPDRTTRLGLSDKAARRLVETSKTRDVKGLIDYLLTELEEVAFDLIDNRPSTVTSRGGVILHVEEP